MADLGLLIPTFLWWPAFLLVTPIGLGVLLWFRQRKYYSSIWIGCIVTFGIGCLYIWWRVHSAAPWNPHPSMNPGVPSADFGDFILLCLLYPILMASFPLLVLVSLAPPKGIKRLQRIGLAIASLTLTLALLVSMFNKAAAYRDSYLKHNPAAAKYMIVK